MVTQWVDVASSRVIHQAGCISEGFPDEIRPAMLILNGLLLRVKARMIIPHWDPEYPYLDLAYLYDLCEIDQQLGCHDVEKLSQLLRGFAEYAIGNPELEFDDGSAAYLRENLQRVVDFLAPKLRGGHLTIYKYRCGKSLEENGAFLFLDHSKPHRPYCFYPAFGLKTVTYANGFIPWRPGSKEMYPPDMNPSSNTLGGRTRSSIQSAERWS